MQEQAIETGNNTRKANNPFLIGKVRAGNTPPLQRRKQNEIR